MDIDFHYHATYAAARFAGFGDEEALTIATSAQMIDENGRHVLIQKTDMLSGVLGVRDDFQLRESPQGPSIHTFRVQMTFQGLGDIGTSADDTLASIWPVYHFLPGNFVPRNLRVTTQVALTDTPRVGPATVHSPLWRVRSIRSDVEPSVRTKFRWLCRPHSPMAIGLVNNCADLVHDRSSQAFKHRLLPYLVGVTMHVFIDTWAHQDFVGPASKAINSREGNPAIGFADNNAYHNFPSTSAQGDLTSSNTFGAQLSASEWKGTAPALPTTESSNLYVGHGQVGHWPDHSAIIWEYQPGWSSSRIVRNNPAHYFDAFVHMVYAMICIRNNLQYTPFEVNAQTLASLFSMSAKYAGDAGIPLTRQRLTAVNRLIQKRRDPWGTGADADLPAQISDKWDQMIYSFGKEWRKALADDLFPEDSITQDWVPGASRWVIEALQTFQANRAAAGNRGSDWLTIQQFQSLDFVRFNLAAKLHYRFVKQQLLAFNESLLGKWADGAAYADDLERVESIPNVRTLSPWKHKAIEVLSTRQRESKKRDVSEGMTILISELEAAANAKQAVEILKRVFSQSPALQPGERLQDRWTYGLEMNENGELVRGKTYEAIQALIAEMERTNGFADQSTFTSLPTVAEWERRSKVMFSLRSSDQQLVTIDRSLQAAHRTLVSGGLSQRDLVRAHAEVLVSACLTWLAKPARDSRRESAVRWLQSATEAWLQQERSAS